VNALGIWFTSGASICAVIYGCVRLVRWIYQRGVESQRNASKLDALAKALMDMDDRVRRLEDPSGASRTV
jgi:hypothetical protein